MIEIRPLSNHTLSSDFIQTFKKMVRSQEFLERTSPSRVLFLRPSQMPFCAMSFYVNHAMKGMYRAQDFGSAYYTSVGTTVHEVLQNFLCRSGKFLANYYCEECKTEHKMSYVHECCDFPTKYNEVEIDYKGIHGHIDAIYKDKFGRLWILDFKTTSLKGAPGKKKDPGVAYKEQIETYAVLTELQYGLKIEGFADAFIVRDNPTSNEPPVWSRPLTDEVRKAVRTRLTRYKKMHKAALDAKTKADALALFDWGRCTDPYCKVCSIESDKKLKAKLVEAYTLGKARGNLPIRAMAERAQAKLDSVNRKKSK